MPSILKMVDNFELVFQFKKMHLYTRLLYTTTGMRLADITLSDRSQMQESSYGVSPFMGTSGDKVRKRVTRGGKGAQGSPLRCCKGTIAVPGG